MCVVLLGDKKEWKEWNNENRTTTSPTIAHRISHKAKYGAKSCKKLLYNFRIIPNDACLIRYQCVIIIIIYIHTHTRTHR